MLAQAATSLRWNRQEAWKNVRRAIEYYVEAGEIQKAVAAATHASLAAERQRLVALLGVSEESFPLARMLEGGSWAAGRRIAAERRPGGGPPFNILSDGTVV